MYTQPVSARLPVSLPSDQVKEGKFLGAGHVLWSSARCPSSGSRRHPSGPPPPVGQGERLSIPLSRTGAGAAWPGRGHFPAWTGLRAPFIRPHPHTWALPAEGPSPSTCAKRQPGWERLTRRPAGHCQGQAQARSPGSGKAGLPSSGSRLGLCVRGLAPPSQGTDRLEPIQQPGALRGWRRTWKVQVQPPSQP